MPDNDQEPREDQPADEQTEKTRKGLVVPTPSREDFFANLERVSRPEDENNGEEASKPEK